MGVGSQLQFYPFGDSGFVQSVEEVSLCACGSVPVRAQGSASGTRAREVLLHQLRRSWSPPSLRWLSQPFCGERGT